MAKVFRCIDFETTGFPPNAGIVEIGQTDLVWEGNTMSVAPETKSELTNPNMPIEIGAMAVHQITNEMLIGKRHPADVLATIEDGADFLVAHNMKFEQGFYRPKINTICTLKSARHLWPEAPGKKLQELRYWLKLELDPERCSPAHRAGPDTYIDAHVLKALLITSAKLGGNFLERLLLLSNKAQIIEFCTFGTKHKGGRWEDIVREDPGYCNWIMNNPRAEEDVVATIKHWRSKNG